jgi:hypothetical protein
MKKKPKVVRVEVVMSRKRMKELLRGAEKTIATAVEWYLPRPGKRQSKNLIPILCAPPAKWRTKKKPNKKGRKKK